MLLDHKKDFSRFIAGNAGVLHFAAHSHHFWPDVSYDAHMQAWLDAARAADLKWSKVFTMLGNNQKHIARLLSLPDPATICFAPSTHDFVTRLLSCFPADKPIRILTTNSEFHSFRRQLNRLEQDGLVTTTRIDAEPFHNFQQRFIDAIETGAFDMVFFSQVFYDSGFAISGLHDIVSAVRDTNTFIVIDGYHGFMAVPTNLAEIADRVFYMAGGYKYAMAGEGVCFMHCPPGYGPAPRDTGWFADYDNKDMPQSTKVHYAADGFRFMGATFDPTGLYRMNAVFDWLFAKDITVHKLRQHALALQRAFVTRLRQVNLHELNEKNLLLPVGGPRSRQFHRLSPRPRGADEEDPARQRHRRG